jgi:hypothetical protein
MLKISKYSSNLFRNPFIKVSSFQQSNNYSKTTNLPPPVSKKVCKGKSTGATSELGQPTFWTHPHLFSISNASDLGKQVTPGITKQEFEQRRTNYVNHLISYQSFYFSSKLSKSEKANLAKNNELLDHNFIAVIPSSITTYMAPDVMHTFKQNSDFLYLTGFREPDSVLVLSRTDTDLGSNTYKTALFVKEKNEKKELWEGPSTGPNLIPKLTGTFVQGFPITEFKTYMDSLVRETNANRKVTLWR